MNEQRIAVRIRETYPKFQFVSKGLIGSGHYGSRRLTGADTTASQRSQARRPLTLRVHRPQNERVAFVTSGCVIQHRETARAVELAILWSIHSDPAAETALDRPENRLRRRSSARRAIVEAQGTSTTACLSVHRSLRRRLPRPNRGRDRMLLLPESIRSQPILRRRPPCQTRRNRSLRENAETAALHKLGHCPDHRRLRPDEGTRALNQGSRPEARPLCVTSRRSSGPRRSSGCRAGGSPSAPRWSG